MTTAYIERKELEHHHSEDKTAFLAEIEKTGGWEHGYKFVQFYHGENRTCRFTNDGTNTGWWTTVASSDDYYWWKISDKKKADIFAEARRQLIAQLR